MDGLPHRPARAGARGAGGLRALVLGAGGAGRAVVFALLQAGAARVEVWNRHPERAAALVSDLSVAAGATDLAAAANPCSRSESICW